MIFAYSIMFFDLLNRQKNERSMYKIQELIQSRAWDPANLLRCRPPSKKLCLANSYGINSIVTCNREASLSHSGILYRQKVRLGEQGHQQGGRTRHTKLCNKTFPIWCYDRPLPSTWVKKNRLSLGFYCSSFVGLRCVTNCSKILHMSRQSRRSWNTCQWMFPTSAGFR